MMKNLTKFKLNRRRLAVHLALSIGMALLFLAALLGGLQSTTPVSSDSDTLYVDGATGSDDSDCRNLTAPCASISYALTQAESGDEIHVAAGAYTETLDIRRTVILRGGYTMSGTLWLPCTGETIVDAGGANRPVFNIEPDTGATIEGFVVQGANHTVGEGGGFFIFNSASVIISDTVIRDNSTVGPGSGLWIESWAGAKNAQVSLINSTVVGNSSVGDTAGLATSGEGPLQVTIENTVFTENTGSDVLSLEQTFKMVGGRVSNNTVTERAISIGGVGTISDTAIMSNTSRALDVWDNGSLLAHNLIVRGNTGGEIVNRGMLTLTNALIENNSGADWGLIVSENFAETKRLVVDGCTIRGNDNSPGVMYVTTGYAEIRNTRIVDNKPTGGVINIGEDGTTPRVEMVNVLLADNDTQGHAVVNHVTGYATLMNVTATGSDVSDNLILYTNGTMTVTNTIVWGNTTNDAMIGGPGALSVSYSDIEGGWAGIGNLDANPLFVNAANRDYHLGAGSPCIDKGTAAGAPAMDIDGDPRDAAPDMGAYERVQIRTFLPLSLRNFGP
jgi:hypothetical protein